MATQKFTNFDKFFFFMYTDMTAVTITIKKKKTHLISNEVKNNLAVLEPSYGKKQMRLLAKPVF